MGFWNRFGAEDRTVCGVDWNALARISRKGDLLAQLKSYGMLFTPDDLEEMLVRYGKKLVHVKKEYATALLASARVQIVDGYHRMMTAELASVHAEVRLPKSWHGFVQSAAVQTRRKRLAELKYLIAAYTMYIAEEPAHPVGTPFPGGYTVECMRGYTIALSVQPRVRLMKLSAGSVRQYRVVNGILCLPENSVNLWSAGRNWRTIFTIIMGDS